MFENAGQKIQGVSKFFFVLTWVGAILGALILFFMCLISRSWDYVGYSFLCLAALPISYIITLFLVGFGRLIENSDKIAEQSTPKTIPSTNNKSLTGEDEQI